VPRAEASRVAFRSHVAIPLQYKGIRVARGYIIDFLVEDCLILEIKSVDKLLPIHSAQLMTYMRLCGVSSGLLMNFNVPILPNGIKRLLL
jgi:GxxExxY protein